MNNLTPKEESKKPPFLTPAMPMKDERIQDLCDSINRGNGYTEKLNIDEGAESETDFNFYPNEEI